MTKCLCNLFGALLLIAALAAATTPAPAQDIPDIQQNETCQQKVDPNSWWLCGAVPADGHITYTNVGIHNVTLFTTGPDGIQCGPPLFADLPVGEQLRECGALQIHEGLAVNASSQTDVDAGQLVYILRADQYGLEAHHRRRLHCGVSQQRSRRGAAGLRRQCVHRVQRDH